MNDTEEENHRRKIGEGRQLFRARRLIKHRDQGDEAITGEKGGTKNGCEETKQ